MVPKGWSESYLGEVVTYKKGYAFNSSLYAEEGIRIVRISDTTRDSIHSDNPVFIAGGNVEGLEQYSLFENDIILSTVGSRPHLLDSMVGKAVKVPRSAHNSLLNQNLVKLIPKKTKITNEYLFSMLKTKEFIQFISNLVRGNANQVSITLADLFKYKFILPSLPEQKKIAQILSTWDKAISVTEKLLTNSQQQKKALMQQLLTGKKRLGLPAGSYEFKITRYGSIPKDWDYPAIKEICTQVSEKNSAAVDHPVLSCSKHDGFVDSLKYFNKKVYSDDLSGYRLIHRGCFGFPSNHIEEGSIGLQNLYDTGIVSPIYVVFRASPTKVDNSYLYAVLKTDHYKQIFGAATNASVDRRGSLRWKEFNQIHVPLPPLKEQQKISAVLSAADAEITTLEKKLACLKDEKKALMQQLLTGKRRVKVDEAVAE
ncbi:restriction endonuclease subunit S [Escherichia coli]|uniref:restriction endonuclease subunit S n=1 Tax=Escherichia coli TaxID=562 RepID=UPI0001E6FF7D|nr:restriction endonuclease subunit S [Escherichia coli]EFP98691.1 type I restriction modification DNA specificity domain protein [Escherichia coli 1827-70]EFB2454107.1 restriction endonuclease subunit S [Escherichia coli]EFO4335483.1 restriction endonuclease subunit S [Escherichia coli]EHK7207685.1 restriction endonuclease subunit S [Escherichia coli]MCV1904813.1 restriction endonuclease subunit S [Escherichia coli]